MSQDDTTDTDYYPQRWECANCGHAFFDSDQWEQWFCSKCGDEMSMVAPDGYVDKGDLRELIDEWLTEGTTYRTDMSTDERATMLDCANQLEELINDD